MDNMKYIKSLEERIEKLEKFIAGIELKNKENISFSNCSIQGIGMHSCKGVTITDMNLQNLGLASFSTKIKNSTIHNFKNQKGKVEIKNCTINNEDK
ncbi:MAG: hypothetical protein J6J13_06705 [Clostridia bacterium]|nr:hypothetical protein [Clostridia bacterium]MBP3706915.1 hypothetical protein [Clostridia bacterium]